MTGRILVTGGLGFIGSEFIRQSSSDGVGVLNVDAFTYAADADRLLHLDRGGPEIVRGDVSQPQFSQVVMAERPSVIVHFAAETHVTRSEVAAARFWATNVDGTRCVLEAAEKADVGLVVHVSTDEVYGSCAGAPFKESAKAPGKGRGHERLRLQQGPPGRFRPRLRRPDPGDRRQTHELLRPLAAPGEGRAQMDNPRAPRASPAGVGGRCTRARLDTRERCRLRHKAGDR
jgi:hypothetical protein